MSTPENVVFKSRVGRRVVILFVVCTILPLWVLAELSVSQVREILIEQSGKRLAAETRNQALGVQVRLQYARDLTRMIASQGNGAAEIPALASDPYLSLVRVSADGSMNAVKGELPPVAIKQASEYRRNQMLSGVQLRSLAGGRLFLFVDSDMGTRHTLWVAELKPEYVWSEAGAADAGSAPCVLDSFNLQVVRCPSGQGAVLAQQLEKAGIPEGAAPLQWSNGGSVFRGQVWRQAMSRDFGTADWYFAMAAPESEQLLTLTGFRRNFMMIVGVIVLLITWVSVSQIRAMVVPLGRLAVGSKRLAENKFGAQVTVATDDEFGELGQAFNSMSTKLGRQFQVSRANAEIDRMIVVRENLESIIGTTLSELHTLLPTLQAYVVLLERTNPLQGRRFALSTATAERGLFIEPIAVPLDERPNLKTEALSPFSTGGSDLAWLRGVAVPGSASHWILPLIWGGTDCGWLWIVGPEKASIGEDDQRIIADLAGRLTLAVFTAWRDDELYQQAHFDALTGLPNRLLFNDRLQREIARCRRETRLIAVMFLDLDNFKSVNDSQGHRHGDLLLKEAALRISRILRETDTVSRHGGDEFAILLTDIRDQHAALRIGESIISALNEPFTIEGQDSYVSASIGIAMHTADGETAEDMLRNADIAMYRAKSTGRAQALFFEERMNTETVTRHMLKRELRTALVNNEFELFFQPQVALANNQIVAVEALLRWRHPQRGLLRPDAFIEVAEESGQINAIGKWVIESAGKHIMQWRADGLLVERIAVNVSTRQLRDADFAEHIQTHVIDKGLARAIEFEITETAMIDQLELVTTKLKTIADAGCRIVLDDFGTGFSSLGYLKRLPVDVVKIDCSFIFDIDKSAESLAFVESIILMAHAMGKTVVAEGVENADQARLLREHRCDLVQGYHFCQPLPLAELNVFMKSNQRPASRRIADSAGDLARQV